MTTRLNRISATLSRWLTPSQDTFASQALNAITDAVIRMDANGNIRQFNAAAARMLGLTGVRDIGQGIDERIHLLESTDANADRICIGRELHRQWQLCANAVLALPDGVLLAVEGHCTPLVENGQATGALLVLRDVSEQRRARRWLAFQATHDALTTLLNRTEIEKRIAQAIRESRSGQRTALLYLDLDQFRIINDSCGHHAGDEFLRQVGKLLQGRVGNQGTLARLGGDEFAVLVPGRSADEARALAEDLIHAVHGIRFSWEHRVLRISASVGIVEIGSEFGRKFDDWRQVMMLADSACCMAKEQGRARAWIAHEGDELIRRRRAQMDWVGRISSALEENRLVLCRQRISALGRQGSSHWEVLVRLREHDQRLAYPESFIPAAERYGLMPAVDRWVIETVLGHLSQLETAHPDRLSPTSINVSGTSLSDNEFLRFIAASFRRYDIDPTRICFEITETAAATDFDAALRFINAVHALGCRISLDDFGSGFSSFSYLKAFRVDYLKIDGAFVRDMDTDETNACFVESINHLGKSLGLATIAEYAESAGVVERLRALGVDYAQGNYIGRPLQWIA